MTKHNRLAQTHDIQPSDQKTPNYILRRRMAGFALGASLLAASGCNAPSAGDHQPDNEKTPTINERVIDAIDDGPEGYVVRTTVEQGDALGVLAQNAADIISEEDKLGLLEGQQAASFVSGQYANEIIYEHTKGAVQPGDVIISWRDTDLGYVVSKPVIATAEKE